jgi:hypothetical protein
MSSPLFGRRQLQKKKLFLTPDSIQMSSPWSNESQEYEDADDPGNMKSANFFLKNKEKKRGGDKVLRIPRI